MAKKHVIDSILKQGGATHPTPDALWCKRCQRGMSASKLDTEGTDLMKSLKAGDDCPICTALALEGEIAADARGILMTCQQVTDEWYEKIKLNHRQREMRMLRSIKDTGDVALEKVNKQDKEIEELKRQISLLTKSDAKTENKSGSK
jgi:hypothetical protein